MSAPVRQRILLVEGNVDGTVGGSYFSLLFLVQQLSRNGYEPSVLFYGENELEERFRQAGAKVCISEGKRPLSQINDLATPSVMRWLTRMSRKPINAGRYWVACVLENYRTIRTTRADLVHLNNSVRGSQSWILACALARVPCVAHERSLVSDRALELRISSRYLSKVLCISEAVRSHLIEAGCPRDRLELVPNGLDPQDFWPSRDPAVIREELGVDTHDPLIAMVGNIRRWKGQHVAIRAMKRIVRAYPSAKCVFVGGAAPHDDQDVEFHRELHALARDEGLEESIVFAGYQSNVADYINAADVLIHCSVRPEPFGRVLLEGMALSKPIVASNDGGVPEIVVDGTTGLLFEPGNDSELADRVLDLLGDRELRESMGKLGHRRLVSKFRAEETALRVQDIYQKVLGLKNGVEAAKQEQSGIGS